MTSYARTLVAMSAVAIAIPASAQFVVVPNAYANSAASTSGLNTMIRDANNPRTGQLLIAASQLTGVNVGDTIRVNTETGEYQARA